MDSKLNDYVSKVLQDLEDIFMAGGMTNSSVSDHSNFLSNISFLKGWPLHKLSEYPSSCMFQYFNAGQIIVRDSNESDWIYIVKSGSVSVMKKLKHVVPKKSVAWERQHHLAKHGPKVSVAFRERKRRQKILPPIKLPDVPKPKFSSHFELQMKMEETIPGAFKENDRLGILDYDIIAHDYINRLKLAKVQEGTPKKKKRRKRSVNLEDRHLEEIEDGEGNGDTGSTRSRFPDIHKTTRGVFMSPSKQRREKEWSLADKENIENNQDSSQSSEDDDDDGGIFTKSNMENTESISGSEMVLHSSLAATQKPVFILVQTLERGNYFGVADVVFRESQPSMSVVSNGAECLLISKSFFKQHSSESIINSLRKTEVPYPSDKELQDKLQDSTDWLAYKTSTYHALVDPIMDRKARRQQYTLGYSGQYNFRTGPT